MSLDGKVLELEQRALEIGKYYYKGFGNSIQGIFADAANFVDEPEHTELPRQAYQTLQQIEDFYRRIPFETLHGKEEFYPLFVVARLLPNFRERMDSVFKEKDEASLRKLQTACGVVVEVGKLYSDSFVHILQEIRFHPEAKDFRIAVKDQLKDMTWYF